MEKLIVKLGGWFQVVEYNTAREILYKLDFGTRREQDDGSDLLRVFNVEKERRGMFYVKPGEEGRTLMASLYVDEGFFSDVLQRSEDGTTIKAGNDPWTELVDAERLLGVLVDGLVPDFKPVPSSFMGGGKTQRHYQGQWTNVLREWTKNNPDAEVQFV